MKTIHENNFHFQRFRFALPTIELNFLRTPLFEQYRSKFAVSVLFSVTENTN